MLPDTRTSRGDWLAFISLAALGIIFLTSWPMYHFIILGGPETTLYYVIACMMAAVLIFIRPHALNPLLNEPLFHWFLVYAITGLLWLVMIDDGYLDPGNRLWRVRFLLMLLFAACFVLASATNIRRLGVIWFCCALFATVCLWMEFLNPFFFVPADHPASNPGRAAGWFLNANAAGNALVLMCVATAPLVSMRWRVFLVLIMFIGVFPTFSRSSLVLAALVTAVWILRGQFSKKAFVALVIVVPLGVAISSELFTKGIDSAEINYKNVMGRLDFFQEMGEASDDSANERRYVAELGWQKFTEKPLLGFGAGKIAENTSTWSYSQSTHNMYLLLLLEQGLFGGFLYLAFLSIIYFKGGRLYRRGLSRQECDIGVALVLIATYFLFIGFFSHTMLKEPIGIMILASLLAEERKMIAGRTQTVLFEDRPVEVSKILVDRRYD
jgi:O-antigen ligase